jgi:hypothetical protein
MDDRLGWCSTPKVLLSVLLNLQIQPYQLILPFLSLLPKPIPTFGNSLKRKMCVSLHDNLRRCFDTVYKGATVQRQARKRRRMPSSMLHRMSMIRQLLTEEQSAFNVNMNWNGRKTYAMAVPRLLE